MSSESLHGAFQQVTNTNQTFLLSLHAGVRSENQTTSVDNVCDVTGFDSCHIFWLKPLNKR